MYLGELGASKYNLKFGIVNPTQKTSSRLVTTSLRAGWLLFNWISIVWAVFLG